MCVAARWLMYRDTFLPHFHRCLPCLLDGIFVNFWILWTWAQVEIKRLLMNVRVGKS